MFASVRRRVLSAVVGLVGVIAGSVQAQSASPPVISTVQPDLTTGVLTIAGANLPATPQVCLGSLPLTVITAGATEIVSDLTLDIPPASYRLLVTGIGKNASATFAVTIGAVGRQGPAGENGPPGRAAGLFTALASDAGRGGAGAHTPPFGQNNEPQAGLPGNPGNAGYVVIVW